MKKGNYRNIIRDRHKANKGVVNGIKRGNASITVKTSSGMQAVCEVRVK
ncbi:MAG: hypothetical protein RHS_2009 [Robinsoniella sp. RHS]|nr:MAG: hypothetical protein RHS_2009 [Robinsoniella sp. RHS]